MFKKIKRNFIIIAMSSVTLILVIVNIFINVTNFNSQVSASDQIIEIIERDNPPEPKINDDKPIDPRVGDSRYFTVDLDGEKKITKINLDHVDKTLVSESIATSYATDVINSNQERGYKDIYRFHLTKNIEQSYRIVFLDCQRSMENYARFVRITLFSSLGALVAYFIIIFFGSNFILKPIKENYEKQNRFITNASHELKTPLTIISANNELIEMKKGNTEYSKNINKQIARMNQMIKGLMTLSKLNEETNILFEKVDIDKLLNNVLKDFRNVCVENSLKIKKHIDKNITVIANTNYIKQILSIIFENAIKYSKSYIDISLIKEKGNVILIQKNDTSYVKEGDLIQYTERFFRDSKSRTNKDGSGIGLSLLEELLRKINAKLKIFGKNNIFNIEIIFSNKNKIK